MYEYLYQRAFIAAQNLASPGAPDAPDVPNVCLEFGVGWGSTYVWQANQIITKFPMSTLIGFDSWQGLPEETNGVWAPDRHAPGSFSYSKNTTLDKLKGIGIDYEKDDRFKFVDGFYKDSLTNDLRLQIKNVIFINIDVDLYSSTIEVLNFVKPLLQKNTIIYWDDWKDPADEHDGKWGEHLAWEEWHNKNLDVKISIEEINEYNQRYMKVL